MNITLVLAEAAIAAAKVKAAAIDTPTGASVPTESLDAF